MAKWILLNKVAIGGLTQFPGITVDDTAQASRYQAILAANGVFTQSTNAAVAAMAAFVTAQHAAKGISEDLAQSYMFASLLGSLQIGGESATGAITAGTTRTRAGATALTSTVNFVTTSTAPAAGTVLGDGVVLRASTPGVTQKVANSTANVIQVYAAGSDTINGIAGATGVPVPPGDVAYFECAVAGAWMFEAGLGATGQLSLVLACDGITAAGTSQATATQLVANINNVTTVAAGTGVNLPASAPGQDITIMNNGANPLLVYPLQGATDTINGVAATTGIAIHPGTTATFNSSAAGAWTVQPASPVMVKRNNPAQTDAAYQLTAADITGGVAEVDAIFTTTITAGRTLTLPTPAQLVAALHAPTVGTSYKLRIINAQAGAFSFTVANNATPWTLVGSPTLTIAQNTWRDFVVTVTAVGTPAVSLAAAGTGTYS